MRTKGWMWVAVLFVAGSGSLPAQQALPAPELTGVDYWIAALARRAEGSCNPDTHSSNCPGKPLGRMHATENCLDDAGRPGLERAEKCCREEGGESCVEQKEPCCLDGGSEGGKHVLGRVPDWGISTFESYFGGPYCSEPLGADWAEVSYHRTSASPSANPGPCGQNGGEEALIDFEVYFIDGLKRYAAIWGPGTESFLVEDLSLEELAEKTREPGVPERLLEDFECYLDIGGDVRYDGLFRGWNGDGGNEGPSRVLERRTRVELESDAGRVLDLEICGGDLVVLMEVSPATTEGEIKFFDAPGTERWEDFHDWFDAELRMTPSEAASFEPSDPPFRLVELEYDEERGFVAIAKPGPAPDWMMVTNSWGRLLDELHENERDLGLVLEGLVIGVPAIPPDDLNRTPQHNGYHGHGSDGPPGG